MIPAERALPPADHPGPRVGWWGIALLVLTEAVLFGALVSSYFLLRFNAPTWPPNDVSPPQFTVPIINTVLLLLSSAAMIWGETGIRAGQRMRLTWGLLGAAVFAAIFLGLQVREYLRAEFTPQDHTYGSLFFTITGLHGLHVLTGFILILALLWWSVLGLFSQRRHTLITNIGIYWHFVTLVWVFLIFPTVYVSPYWH